MSVQSSDRVAESAALRDELATLRQLLDVHEQVSVQQADKLVATMKELQRGMDLAQHIQTSILPRSIMIRGLTVAARMAPASRVGGDYYDVMQTKHGCWIGIGDVSGHGLDAGLIMLMVQSMIAVLVRRDPDGSPRELLCALNECLFENIHNRMRRDEYATLTIFRIDESGQVVFAGAHEDILVFRAAEGRCEVIETPGTWVGARASIEAGTVESSLQLHRGDLMLLYSDGITEAMSREGEQFGPDRLAAAFCQVHAAPPPQVAEHLLATLAEWCSTPNDDVTLLVARYDGPSNTR
jgi:phosphoserine phosphatase RsbU/P